MIIDIEIHCCMLQVWGKIYLPIYKPDTRTLIGRSFCWTMELTFWSATVLIWRSCWGSLHWPAQSGLQVCQLCSETTYSHSQNRIRRIHSMIRTATVLWSLKSNNEEAAGCMACRTVSEKLCFVHWITGQHEILSYPVLCPSDPVWLLWYADRGPYIQTDPIF